MKNLRDLTRSRSLPSSLIGLGLGTIAALYGQSTPKTFWSQFFGVLAPALGAAGDVISAVLVMELATWWYTKKVDKARARIHDFLQNPHSSEAHRADLQRQLENLESESVANTAAMMNPILGLDTNANQRPQRKGSSRS